MAEFFNQAHEEEGEIMKEQYRNPMIHKAIDVLKTLSEDEEIRHKAEMREQSMINEAILLNGERKKGREEGMKEGEKRGIRIGEERGLRKGKIDAIELGLILKFPEQVDTVMPAVRTIQDLGRLEQIASAIKTSENVEQVLAMIGGKNTFSRFID